MDFTKLRELIMSKRFSGLKQKEISKLVEISTSRLSQITWGRVEPTLQELKRFCIAFNCQLSDLVVILKEI